MVLCWRDLKNREVRGGSLGSREGLTRDWCGLSSSCFVVSGVPPLLCVSPKSLLPFLMPLNIYLNRDSHLTLKYATRMCLHHPRSWWTSRKGSKNCYWSIPHEIFKVNSRQIAGLFWLQMRSRWWWWTIDIQISSSLSVQKLRINPWGVLRWAHTRPPGEFNFFIPLYY